MIVPGRPRGRPLTAVRPAVRRTQDSTGRTDPSMAQLERPPREHLRSRTAVPEPAVAPVVRIRPLTAATLEQPGAPPPRSPSDPARPRPPPGATVEQPVARLTVPTSDRAALVPAVVHLSVGGFSRAHQLTYFDDVAERRISGEWGVVGVGLRHRLMQEALAPQDNLYTVVERSPDGERARVVGVLTDYLFAPDAPAAVLDRLADPRPRGGPGTITPPRPPAPPPPRPTPPRRR